MIVNSECLAVLSRPPGLLSFNDTARCNARAKGLGERKICWSQK